MTLVDFQAIPKKPVFDTGNTLFIKRMLDEHRGNRVDWRAFLQNQLMPEGMGITPVDAA